jgi:hypothetical protein
MDSVSLDLAFTRLGADIPRGRPLCATAKDGSLVLVCHSTGFNRPGAGVLRYSAVLSQMSGVRAHITALRASLDAASAARTPIRLIIQTPGGGGASSRIHTRADLIGSVSAFDGDAYSVDFVRVAEEEPEPPARGRRKR